MQDATTGNRCLARLCDLTSPSLLTQLWPIVLRIARLIAQFRSGEPSPEGMYQFERDLGKLLGQLGRGIVQWTINQIEPRDRDLIPRELFLDGDHYHPHEYFTKVLSRIPDPLSPGTYLSWEWVVDYYHACGYIALLGEAIFGPGRAAHAWGAKMRRVLKKKPGGVFRLLRSAGALKSIRGLVGDEASYEKAYGYLRGHADWMKYDQLRQQYKPIGSGVTEAACKTLFTQRFKRAGMKWNVEDGRSILQLREIAISGVWRQTRHAMLASQAACRLRTPKRNAKESVKIA